MRTPAVKSVLQCAAMGALAFCIMFIVYRLSLGSSLFSPGGLLVALVVGGIAGAAVRYYFARLEQETEASAVIPEEGDQDANPQELVTHHQLVAPPAPTIPETEIQDVPKQIELFPSWPENKGSGEPDLQDMPAEPASVPQPERSDRPPDEVSIERHFFAWITDHARIFCLVVNAQDEIVMANRFLEDSLGYAAGELRGKRFTEDLVPPSMRGGAWTHLLDSPSGPTPGFTIQGHLRMKDGREVPVEWHGSAMFTDEGRLSRCFLLGTDMRERQRLEEELRDARTRLEQELRDARIRLEEELRDARVPLEAMCAEATNKGAFFRSILDSSTDAMIVFDMQGTASYANPAFTELCGWTVEDLQDRESPFVPAAQRDLEEPFLKALKEQGTPLRNLDTKRQCKDGRLVSVRMTASVIRDRRELPSGMLVTLRALVERSKSVKEPEQQAAPQPKKRQVNAKEIARDILSGASDAQLMEKFKLTAKGLHSVFQKLIEAKVIKPSQIVRRSAAYDETVAIELSRIVPLEQPPPRQQPKPQDTAKVTGSIPRVKTDVRGLKGLGLTDDSLEELVKDLLPKGVATEPKAQESSLNTQELEEDVTARRAMPRNYMVVSVPIYESNNLLREGTIIDISEQGLKIQGIDTVKGETKSLLIQGDEFHDVFPFIFDAVCRWATTDETTGETLAGFQITAISETSIGELRKLIAALSISA